MELRKEFNSKPSSTLLNSPLVEAAGSSLRVTIFSHPQEQPEFEVILRDIRCIFYTLWLFNIAMENGP